MTRFYDLKAYNASTPQGSEGYYTVNHNSTAVPVLVLKQREGKGSESFWSWNLIKFLKSRTLNLKRTYDDEEFFPSGLKSARQQPGKLHNLSHHQLLSSLVTPRFDSSFPLRAVAIIKCCSWMSALSPHALRQYVTRPQPRMFCEMQRSH